MLEIGAGRHSGNLRHDGDDKPSSRSPRARPKRAPCRLPRAGWRTRSGDRGEYPPGCPGHALDRQYSRPRRHGGRTRRSALVRLCRFPRSSLVPARPGLGAAREAFDCHIDQPVMISCENERLRQGRNHNLSRRVMLDGRDVETAQAAKRVCRGRPPAGSTNHDPASRGRRTSTKSKSDRRNPSRARTSPADLVATSVVRRSDSSWRTTGTPSRVNWTSSSQGRHRPASPGERPRWCFPCPGTNRPVRQDQRKIAVRAQHRQKPVIGGASVLRDRIH